MKNKITRHNYEAFFLDYSEGNICDEDSALLMQFLEANPDLREELEAFAPVSLTPTSQPEEQRDWSALKMPVSGDSADRDILFFRAVEGALSENDKKVLDKLLTNDVYRKEYELWQKLKLAADKGIAFPKDGMYKFGHEMPLSQFTFEHYLIARCEGLLNAAQNVELERFAVNIPNGHHQLELADKLRLQPARAVFFPDKDKLYRKDDRQTLVLWYRIAGVAAALLLVFAMWTWYGVSTIDTQMAGDKNKVKRHTERTNSPKTDTPDSTENAKKVLVPAKETPLEEWQMREPDELEIAFDPKPAPAKTTKRNLEINMQEVPAQLQPEIPENQLVEVPDEASDSTNATLTEAVITDENLAAAPTPDSDYKTISEIAEEKFLKKMDLTEEERDALALTVAKRAAERAGSLLNSEFTKERTVDKRGENLTYTLRVGSFKASHSKTR